MQHVHIVRCSVGNDAICQAFQTKEAARQYIEQVVMPRMLEASLSGSPRLPHVCSTSLSIETIAVSDERDVRRAA
jgi:hypothetical protein